MSEEENKLLEDLLSAWEVTYKKGQLTLWVFLALKDGEKYVEEIQKFVSRCSCGTMRCEDQSLYRTLRKFKHLGVVEYRFGVGSKGPDRKYYYLTPLGADLLSRFIKRNISLFFNPEIKKLLVDDDN